MKGSTKKVIAIFTAILVVMVGSAQAKHTQADRLAEFERQLRSEIKGLRVELVKQALEFSTWKARHLERELEEAQAEQRSLDEEERAINQRIAALSDAEAIDASRASEIESDKLELNEGLQRLQGARQKIAHKTEKLSMQLEREKERIRELRQEAAKLKSDD